MKVNNLVVRDRQIHTEQFGSSQQPAIVLISGAMATARFWDDEFCQALAENYFVIRYDHRDIGESDGVDWQVKPYSLVDLADDAIAILDHYYIDQAHFVGHSMGGYVAQQLAVAYPHRVKSIVSISAGPINATVETEAPLTEEEQAKQQQAWQVFLSREDSLDKEKRIEGFMRVWRHLNGTYSLENDLARAFTLDILDRNCHPFESGNNHEKLMQNIHDHLDQAERVVDKIQCPSLIINGSEDPVMLPRFGHAIANQITDSRLIIQPGMGHMLFNRDLQQVILRAIYKHVSKI